MPTQAWYDTILDLLIRIERNDIVNTIKDNFYHQLECKTSWDRNELKEVFEKSIAKVVEKGNPPWQL